MINDGTKQQILLCYALGDTPEVIAEKWQSEARYLGSPLGDCYNISVEEVIKIIRSAGIYAEPDEMMMY